MRIRAVVLHVGTVVSPRSARDLTRLPVLLRDPAELVGTHRWSACNALRYIGRTKKERHVNFLDRRTADFSDPGLRALHEVMILAYDDEVEALALAGQVGLLRADIARSPKLRYTWVSIIEEAAKEGQLRRLVDLAVRDPTIAGFHTRIREAISIPSGSIAKNEKETEPDTELAAGQQPEIGERALLWDPGITLGVRFLDGASVVRSKVEAAASKWLEYANLHFDFAAGDDAPIRVSFKQPGSWAYQGRSALLVRPTEPTVNFGWIDENTPMREDERVIMHEFGHVLGLQHEHGNPASTIQWDRPAVYRNFSGPPNYWTREQIDQTIFAVWPPGYYPVHKVFDRASIMIFPLSADYLRKGRSIGSNYRLSQIDKQFAAALYPVRVSR